MASKKAPATASARKVGRPRAEVQLKPISINFDPTLLAGLERARVRREKQMPGVKLTMSDAIRALLLRAIAAEEGAEPQGELPLNNPALESSTTKKH